MRCVEPVLTRFDMSSVSPQPGQHDKHQGIGDIACIGQPLGNLTKGVSTVDGKLDGIRPQLDRPGLKLIKLVAQKYTDQQTRQHHEIEDLFNCPTDH